MYGRYSGHTKGEQVRAQGLAADVDQKHGSKLWCLLQENGIFI